MSNWFTKKISTSRTPSSHSSHPSTPHPPTSPTPLPPAPLRGTIPLPIPPDMPSQAPNHHYSSQRPPSRSEVPVLSRMSASIMRQKATPTPIPQPQPQPQAEAASASLYQSNPEGDYITWGDGKVTSPHPHTFRRPSDAGRTPPRGILKRSPSSGRPPAVERSASVPPKERSNPSTPPGCRPFEPLSEGRRLGYALHWMILPFNENQHKAKVHYDVSDLTDNITLEDGFDHHRMLSREDREKSACKIPIQSIVIFHQEFPNWKTFIDKPRSYVRVIDVLDAIHDMFDVCITAMERGVYANIVRSSLALHAQEDRINYRSQSERARNMRRFDLLLEKKYFGGLEWIEPCEDFPDGAWTLVMKTKEEIDAY
ncbi:hypothetical protein OF83DRAFT_1293226 [Amylostereum chailletii]|nr:hypothetical protein OF83DRAFT_1293226 [Amylostereum chailletii]